jgi:hypothetical protein
MPPPPLVLSALRRLLSADASPPVCLLYASPPVASCLPAGCRVAPVVAPPPTPPHDFASTSSSPSGCRNSQRPTCRAAAASRPLAASAPQPLNASPPHWLCRCPSPMRRRRCRRCAGVFAGAWAGIRWKGGREDLNNLIHFIIISCLLHRREFHYNIISRLLPKNSQHLLLVSQSHCSLSDNRYLSRQSHKNLPTRRTFSWVMIIT